MFTVSLNAPSALLSPAQVWGWFGTWSAVKKHPPDWSFKVLLCLLSAGCDLIGRCVDEQTLYLFWGEEVDWEWVESLFIKFGNHGNDCDASVGLFFGHHCFIKSDDGAGSWYVFLWWEQGLMGTVVLSECTQRERRKCYHGNVRAKGLEDEPACGWFVLGSEVRLFICVSGDGRMFAAGKKLVYIL